jgi:eukaryotic-like serine/threonine-protein kinase
MRNLPPERWQQIDDLFAAALERPPAERLAFLESACAGDHDLQREVVELLESESEAGAVLGESATGFAAPLLPGLRDGLHDAEPAADPLPERIGPYRVVRELGRGGMGAVYLAERADEQFHKRVALKLVKRGMDTDEVLQRFRYERQILASLEHPHIARLLDGGASEDGRPYLVMELVEGLPIDRFCEERRLGVEARLALFCSVCRAVQYAHQNLVVHRDLKPSNILVQVEGRGPAGKRKEERGKRGDHEERGSGGAGEQGNRGAGAVHSAFRTPHSAFGRSASGVGEGTVKLLDFGIAKLLDEAAGDGDPRTRTGIRLLTPEYAAPEQLRGERVTVASDVYALGIVLYRLLTGRGPHAERRGTSGLPANTGEGGGVPPPSAVAPTPSLRRLLRGDLDTIVLQALAPEPERRYASVQQLLDDVERHLRGLPVTAQRDSVLYRARKFVRRHRAGVVAATLAVLSLLGGTGAALWQAERAARERDVAQQVTAFLEGLFQASNPFSPEPERLDTLRVRDLLARGAARVQSELDGQPAVQAHMLGVLGEVYRSLGQYEQAQPLLEQALESRSRLYGAGHPDVAASQAGLAMLRRNRGDLQSAEQLLRAALATRRTHFGGEHLAVAETMHELGSTLRLANQHAEAEVLLREALAVRRRLLSEPHPEVARTLTSLATLVAENGDPAGAERLHEEALSLHRRLYGETHPHVATSLLSLASVRLEAGRAAEAEPLVRQALAIYRSGSGPAHPHLPGALDMLARTRLAQGSFDDAGAAARESLELRMRLFGERHPGVLPGLYTLGSVLQARGELDAAESHYRQALAISREVATADRHRVAVPLGHLADLLRGRGVCAEAEALYRERLALLEERFPPGHRRLVEARERLGSCRTPG